MSTGPGRHRVPDAEDQPGGPTLVRTVTPDVTAVLQAAPTALLLLTLTGEVVAGNAAAEELVDRGGADLAGIPIAALVPELATVELSTALDRARAGHHGTTSARLVRADGRELPVSITVAGVPGESGRATHLVVHLEDRTEQTARESRLVHRAFHDPLTGLPHRTLFLYTLHGAVTAAHESGTSTCVLVLEVSGLAELDAAHGHAAGDRAVVELARRLRTSVRAADTAACLGPETFAVLCEDTGAEQGSLVAARLSALTSGPVQAIAGTVELVTAVRVTTVHDVVDPAVAFGTLLGATTTAPDTGSSPRGRARTPPRPPGPRRRGGVP